MPVVFVHGVNNRRGSSLAEQAAFDQRVRLRNEMFRTEAFSDIVAPPETLTILSPYWGDEGAKFAWSLASIPKPGNQESLGGDEEKVRLARVAASVSTPQSLSQTTNAQAFLITLAREASLTHAVDALIAVMSETSFAGLASNAEAEVEISRFAARANAYAAAQTMLPDWVKTVPSDMAFVSQLRNEVAAWVPVVSPAGEATSPTIPKIEALGLGDLMNRLQMAVGKLGQAVKDVLMDKGGDLLMPTFTKNRPVVTELLGRFTGDIFNYFNERGTKDAPGKIVKIVLEDLEKAVAAKTATDDKLIIVAHSMGGNIIYDILTHFKPDLHCDLLVTAGTQVAFFEEMKLFRQSDKNIVGPDGNVLKPANVGHWINIFDPSDILGFTTSKIITGVDNFEFDCQTLPIISHGLYFERPRFHARLRARIAEARKTGAMK